MNRYKDWLEQAEYDLEAAIDSLKGEHYEWSCFQAQQAAEKSFKALLLFTNLETWGHGLIRLLKNWTDRLEKSDDAREMSQEKYQDLFEKCQELDRHYIQPRYPSGFASGYPAMFYNKKIAEECIYNAKTIIGFVKEKISSLSPSK